MNQVVSFERVIYYGYIQEFKSDPSTQLKQVDVKKRRFMSHIAFGTKIGDPSKDSATVTQKKQAEPSSPKREYENNITINDQHTPYRDSAQKQYDEVNSSLKKLRQKYTPAKIVA